MPGPTPTQERSATLSPAKGSGAPSGGGAVAGRRAGDQFVVTLEIASPLDESGLPRVERIMRRVADYVDAVARSLIRQGARRVVFLNTGIFKATGLPLAIVARDIRTDLGVPTLVVSWDDLETAEAAALAEQERGGHADEIETSINLCLQPERVHRTVRIARRG